MVSKNRNLQELDSGRAEFIPPCFSFGELDRSQGTVLDRSQGTVPCFFFPWKEGDGELSPVSCRESLKNRMGIILSQTLFGKQRKCLKKAW